MGHDFYGIYSLIEILVGAVIHSSPTQLDTGLDPPTAVFLGRPDLLLVRASLYFGKIEDYRL